MVSSGQPRLLQQEQRTHQKLGSRDLLCLVARDSFPIPAMGYPDARRIPTGLSAKLQTQEANCLPDISRQQGQIHGL